MIVVLWNSIEEDRTFKRDQMAIFKQALKMHADEPRAALLLIARAGFCIKIFSLIKLEVCTQQKNLQDSIACIYHVIF